MPRAVHRRTRLGPRLCVTLWSQLVRLPLLVLALLTPPVDCADPLPPECEQPWWREFYKISTQICKDGVTCMNHPMITEKATACLIQALPWKDTGCVRGLGAAAAFMLRSLTTRLKSVALVDVVLDDAGGIAVDLALSVWDSVQEKRLPLDFSFAPFPYNVRTLLPFRVRTWLALAQLYSGAAKVLTQSAIPHFAWLGGLRFWSELVGALAQARGAHPAMFPDGAMPALKDWSRLLILPPQEYTPDIVVPAELEQALLSLGGEFEQHGQSNPLERFFIHSVAPGRSAQIVTNNFAEFGHGIDVRHLCSNCVVLNVYFYRRHEGTLLNVTADTSPCSLSWAHIFPLARMDAISGFPEAFRGQIGAGLMPRQGLQLLSHFWRSYFGAPTGAPCFWDDDMEEQVAEVRGQAELGPVSAFVMRDLKKEDLGARPQDRGPIADGSASLPLVLASTDFSEGILELDGIRGWFDFMQLRMGSQRPALQGYQQKIWMKQLMQERGVPIPRLLHTSEHSPELPFRPRELPRLPTGYCVKPAHLAEAHNTFALTPEGVNILDGSTPTFDEVQGNISYAWSRSLGDYDQTPRDEGGGCAVSGVHAPYLEGRPCTNWALYTTPPGLVIEELVQPSPLFANFQSALLKANPSEPPDEIKCHVVWGKVFICEWVTPKLMLGYIFRHGFVKNTIVISPEYQKMCYGGERVDGAGANSWVCQFKEWWASVVEVAERAVPKGVDYLRVDIFPNGMAPVVNELSVAGYSTLLEDWMLKELMRRVKEGYLWRGARREAQPPTS